MTYLFTDIETIPVIDEVRRKRFMSTVKPPGNIKLQKSKDAWLADADNIDNAVRKTSFDAAWGSILCIGAAIDGGDVEVIREDTEKKTLQRYIKMLRTSPAGTASWNSQKIVGHYVIHFDAKFIHQRMLINGLGPLFPYDSKPYNREIMCTGQMFTGGDRDIPSLDALCAAFDIPSPKTEGLDGSMIYDAFLAGEFERIDKYCASDVEQMRKVFAKMMRNS